MLINGAMYACEACVRGNRASDCLHEYGPLQHVREKVTFEPTDSFEPESLSSERPILLETYARKLDNDILPSMGHQKRPASPDYIAPRLCREPNCGKEFKRPSDLTKYEKTHSRSWKCPVKSCKYHEYGWPTEKEMDRHHSDKHCSDPPLYECHYKPCPYRSKRESNCNQHMQKAHGWTYTRFMSPETTNNGPPSSEGNTVANIEEEEFQLPVRKGSNRTKYRPSQGDAVLVSFMAGGKHSDIARHAGDQPLASDNEEGEEPVKGTEVETMVVEEKDEDNPEENGIHLATLPEAALRQAPSDPGEYSEAELKRGQELTNDIESKGDWTSGPGWNSIESLKQPMCAHHRKPRSITSSPFPEATKAAEPARNKASTAIHAAVPALKEKTLTANGRDLKWAKKIVEAQKAALINSRGAASPFAAHLATPYQRPTENQRKVLRVLIKNKQQLACPDSGSAKNIISESLANECGLNIRCSPKDIKQFELGSGKIISSVGRVRVPVKLLGNPLRRKKYWFYVFSTCPAPLILGMLFLEEAQILTKNRHMLEICPAELSTISFLLWIGSSRNKSSPRNRVECSLDGHQLEVVADTGSDLNLMSLKCAKREGFQINRRREARRRILVGDGTEAETIGQVYIHNLSMDWRKAPTTSRTSIDVNNIVSAPDYTPLEQDEKNIGTIFHVLPGLPCEVIFGRDLLDQTDTFNLCPNLYPKRTTKKDSPFELNILISLGPVSIRLPIPRRRQQCPVVNPDPKEIHDDERHAEMFRRTKREEEITAEPVEHQGKGRSRERRRIREWDALHRECAYCNPV
ncbi:hypothetical protein F5882DRAFT_517283 [Hyaloscypha sp. PMI_1271]|nr:hypothetical protein F5882DRAFT_517283 [Hyaloscypha sp. PMI_1271]